MNIFAVIFLVLTTILVAVLANDGDTCTIDGVTIKKGEHYNPIGLCERIYCTGDGELGGTGCPQVSSPPCLKCKMSPFDLTKPFPHCCPKLQC